ncbi:MAG: hypothetical protein IKD13_07660 [Firmicutes bacterium]|nr:hypothetical protein [Bacillota bacterium]
MNKAKRTGGFAPPAVGGTSLLVMFAVLCLTTFAVLSLSTVKAGDRLATASAEAVTEYYAADLEAERILSRLRSGEIPEGVTAEGSAYSYFCPLSETQELHVKVRVEGDVWEILQWKVVSSVDWEADETIDVWDGQLPSQQ